MIYEITFVTHDGHLFSQQFNSQTDMNFWKYQNDINRGIEHYEVLSETVLLLDKRDYHGWKYLGKRRLKNDFRIS